MATRMIQRRGTAAEWTSANPVLAAGEIGFETDTQKFKFGDGTTAWADITYFASADQLIDGAPELLDTLNEIAAAIGDDEDFFNTINDKIEGKANLTIADSVPTNGPDGTENLQEGDLWYDRSNGHIYVYYHVDTENDIYVWVEAGGSDAYADASLGTNNHDFPTSPSDNDTHKGFIYNSNRTAWQLDRSYNLDDASDVVITSVSDGDVLSYNDTASEWINLPGIPLDENLDIPLSYMTQMGDDVDDKIAGFGTTTVQTEAEWTADTTVPDLGSLNISTGDSIRAKIGDGSSVFDDLEYVPNNSYVAAQITTALSTYATKADPTFSGTVSLPSTTSIGDVSNAEIAHLDGVTSGIQGQLDDLDTLKAPIADPTFTGTVSGVTASMVGLGNVDNTADADKPVSTATQTALDLKANLSGATFGGSVVIEGDLTVSGATTTVYASDLSVRDNMIYLNQGGYFTVTAATGDGANVTYTTDADHAATVGEYITVTGADPATFDISGEGSEITAVTANTITVASSVTDTFVSGGSLRVKSHANPDLGWSAGRYDVVNGSGYGHAGIFRDATDGVFKIYDGYVPEPDESVFIDTTDASFALAPVAVGKVVFPDGTEQTAAAVPSLTTFTEKAADYQLDTLDHKDNIVEMNMSTAGTFTVPLDATLTWPVGASMDIFATGTGEITIAGEAGVTLNATPGLTLRTQWSSATIMKRGANNWVVYGDLKA